MSIEIPTLSCSKEVTNLNLIYSVMVKLKYGNQTFQSHESDLNHHSLSKRETTISVYMAYRVFIVLESA